MGKIIFGRRARDKKVEVLQKKVDLLEFKMEMSFKIVGMFPGLIKVAGDVTYMKAVKHIMFGVDKDGNVRDVPPVPGTGNQTSG